MTSINPIFNANFQQLGLNSNKQAKQSTNPISQTSVNFKGTEALAAYNYSLVNKDDVFNLPVIKPLEIETDINKIDGEKIYNSKGNIVRIVNDNDSQKEVYHLDNNGKISYYTREDKESGVKWRMYLPEDENFMTICKVNPNGVEYSTSYENGQITGVSKRKYYPNGDDDLISYSLENKETFIAKHYTKNGYKYSSFATFDKNKKCIEAFESRDDKYTDLYFKDGIPYEIKTSESKSMSNISGTDDIDLTGLEPDKMLQIDFDSVGEMDGEKKYFSNGQVEEIITPEGNIYKFNLDGLESVKAGNTEYLFGRDDDGKYSYWNIITDLGNGITKRTSGWTDSTRANVFIEKGDESIKSACYNENGTLSNIEDNQLKIYRDFDNNGNLIRVWDEA